MIGRSTPVRDLAHLERDRGYRWQDHVDPVLEFIRNDITDSGWPLSYLAERSGVAVSTLRAWQSGKTRHPQNQTVDVVLRALGWPDRMEVLRRAGQPTRDERS